MPDTQIPLTLAQSARHQKVQIVGFNAPSFATETRLREIGFAEGDILSITHVGLFGGSPLNVRLHHTSIAVRPQEAAMITVKLIEKNEPK